MPVQEDARSKMASLPDTRDYRGAKIIGTHPTRLLPKNTEDAQVTEDAPVPIPQPKVLPSNIIAKPRDKKLKSAPHAGNKRRLLIAATLVVIALALIVSIAFATSGGLSFGRPISGSSLTSSVTITPISKDEKDSFVLTAVTGTPDTSQRQVQARQLSYTTPSQSNTVPATGQVNTKAIQATGVLTFSNGNQFEYTVRAGTVFTDSHGVQIENVGAVFIPAGNPQTGYGHTTASAIAVVGGTSGNIQTLDFNQVQCCGSGAVYVSNLSAFSGGQDSQHYTAVQQSDIDGAAGPLKTSQTQNAQKALQAEIKSNEKLVNPAQCSTNVTSNHHVGDKATSVTVGVTATCTGEVYDQAERRRWRRVYSRPRSRRNWVVTIDCWATRW